MHGSLKVVALVLIVACETSPTALGELDQDRLEALAARNGAGGPAQRVWLDLIGELQKPGVPTVVLPELDSLFTLALVSGEPAVAELARQNHRELLQEAWSALDRGDREDGERGLLEARVFQAETIVEKLGPVASQAFVVLVGRTVDRVREDGLGNGAAADPRLDAMTLTARDLVADARAALNQGNAAAALDLTAHAAGLTNMVVRALNPR